MGGLTSGKIVPSKISINYSSKANMKSVGFLFQINGLGEEQIMTYHKPPIPQLAPETEFDWPQVDVFFGARILAYR